nr:hypothetical protein [Streptomyces sp. NRRL S-37]
MDLLVEAFGAIPVDDQRSSFTDLGQPSVEVTEQSLVRLPLCPAPVRRLLGVDGHDAERRLRANDVEGRLGHAVPLDLGGVEAARATSAGEKVGRVQFKVGGYPVLAMPLIA